MNCWVRNRVMGEAEAVYRLITDFKFGDSDAVCVFAQVARVWEEVLDSDDEFVR